MNDNLIDELALRIAYDIVNCSASVHVAGDIDMLTAPTLAGVLQVLIDTGHQLIVIDLARSEFVDARGASVFADAARRASALGGSVTIRSASAITQRMFDITGVSDLVVFDTPYVDPLPALTGLVPSSTEVVDAALRLVTALADATITNADGVSVTLERHGQLMTVAASNDKVLTMDHHQYETGEGPCLDAKEQDRRFYIESLAAETRWPTFVPLALDQGIHSILSSPLKTSDRAQGALNIYSNIKQAFGDREQELAALFAAQASQILTAAGQDVTHEDTNERFASALAARQLIHQAQGVVMARDGLMAEDAIGSLFRSARAANISVLAHATRVIASLRSNPGTS